MVSSGYKRNKKTIRGKMDVDQRFLFVTSINAISINIMMWKNGGRGKN